MTIEKLSDAITELDSDILDRYFVMKQSLAKKKKPRKQTSFFGIRMTNYSRPTGLSCQGGDENQQTRSAKKQNLG